MGNTKDPLDQSHQQHRKRAIAPVLILLFLTALLHLLVIEWGKKAINLQPSQDPSPAQIEVALLPLAAPDQPVKLPVKVLPKPAPPSTPVQAKSVAAVPPAAPPPLPPAVTSELPEPSSTPTVGDANPADQTATATAAANTAPSPAISDAPTLTDSSSPATTRQDPNANSKQYVVSPPPPATLEYQVQAFSNNLHWFGTSKLTWLTDGEHYSVEGEVYARFFAKITFLNFLSQGEIDGFGVSPELYTEKKRNRAATNTHFNRERNLISFSASEQRYPRQGGEQDRASVIWQLAAIGRGDASQFGPDKVIDLFVAGVRDGELWRLQITGQEAIQLPTGQINTWHVVRQPQPGSYQQRLDIWQAPELQWYPVRLRFTETNGDYLELTMDEVKSL